MISVTNLGKAYGDRWLFRDVSLQFDPGKRYGVVGANGSGKSTFLRLLAGEETPTEGSVSIPKRARLGVLRQDQFLYEDVDIIDVVLMGKEELWKAMREKEEMLAAPPEAFDADRFGELEEIVQAHDGYSQEAKAATILEGLGIPTEAHRRPLSTLSGGFKLRVLLARTLASDPDILLLDEPTNHLDIVSIRWLESFLQDFAGCVIVVTHDHRFLDEVSTHVVDVDYETLIVYTGNYSAFVEAKEEERARRELEIARKEEEIARHQAFVDRFRAKATKARQAQSRVKLIERIEIQDLPRSSRQYPSFRFTPRRHSGKTVVEAERISKAFGDNQVLEGVSLRVMRGDRLAVIGPNGVGKSTLLKILVGDLEADEGAVDWGYETHVGWFPQDHKAVFESSDRDVEGWLWDRCPGEPVGFVRKQLGLVLFSGDDVKKKVTALSGGEAARLLFASLAVQHPNVLVLDEPTNHLDLEAIEALVESLAGYEGTLVFVSHDRWFVSQLADRILEITLDGIDDFPGSYEEFVARRGQDHLDVEAVDLRVRREKEKGEASPRQDRAAGDKERARRRKELEALRDAAAERIEAAEARIREIEAIFCRAGYFEEAAEDEVRALEKERRELESTVEKAMQEWEAAERELVGRRVDD